jgi:hypothetical protein
MRLSASPVILIALLAGVGCDSTPRGRDASAAGQPPAQRQTEIAVRVDAPNGGSPSVSVLAYRALSTGVGSDEILGIVDPLVALPPEAGQGCVRRDIAGVARALGDRGGKVELESLSNLRVDLGAGLPPLLPLPRVYPDLASAVGGVIGEAGPVDVAAAPQTLGLQDQLHPGGGLTIELPPLPRLFDVDGTALAPNPTFTLVPGEDLELGLTGPASTFVELRPFGATWALACARSAVGGNRVVIPAAELARLADLRVPISLEAVAREPHQVVLGGILGAAPTRLTIEVRTSSVVKLRP